MILSIILILAVVAADQISKILIINTLGEFGNSVGVIDGFFRFTYTANTGVSFSFFTDASSWVMIALVSILLIAACIYLFKNIKYGKLFSISLSLIIGGGLGNLIDRIFRWDVFNGVAKGYVVDFIDLEFINYPVFNVADIFVCVGAGLLILYLIISTVKEFKEKKREKVGSTDI